MKRRCVARIGDEVHSVELSPGTLLDSLLAAKIPIEHSCGGNGTCTTCHITVRQWNGKIPERSELESERAEERGFLQEERLACQLSAEDCDLLELAIP